MEGATTGSVRVMSDSGWSHFSVFQQYILDHFLPFKQLDSDPSQHTLLLYDGHVPGHASNVSASLIDWAKDHVQSCAFCTCSLHVIFITATGGCCFVTIQDIS